jgi:hypothetical protein
LQTTTTQPHPLPWQFLIQQQARSVTQIYSLSVPGRYHPPAHGVAVIRSVLEVTPKGREKILKDVEYNIFAFPAGIPTSNFLYNSGASTIMDVQWAAHKWSLLLLSFF